MEERWASLNNLGFSKYDISDLGNIRNVRTKYILKQKKNQYMNISIYNDDDIQITVPIAFLVMNAFVGPRPKGMTIDHINQNPLDNRLCNLRYATGSEQNLNRKSFEWETGTQISQHALSGERIKIWPKITAASKELGISRHVIRRSCNGTITNTDQFIWKYYIEYIPDEEWKPVRYGNFDFLASSHGRIKMPSGKVTYGSTDAHGYRIIHTTKTVSGVKIDDVHARVHRLVARAFLGESDLHVNHEDRDKQNNKIANLTYMTQKENMLHALRTGLKSAKPVGKFGSDDIFIERYLSLKEAARENNLDYQNISAVCKGKRFTCGEFKWKFASEDGFIEPEIIKSRRIGKQYKQVCQYGMNGKYLATYDTLKNAAKFNGLSNSQIETICYRPYILTTGGFIWKFVEDGFVSGNDIVIPTNETTLRGHEDLDNPPDSISIYQFDLKGVFIDKYNTTKEAAQKYQIKPYRIVNACTGKNKSTVESIWRCVIGNEVLKIGDPRINSVTGAVPKVANPDYSRPIHQYNLNGIHVWTYNNINEVAKKYNYQHSNIRLACIGERPTAYNYFWRFVY
jgi:hypothetical protein